MLNAFTRFQIGFYFLSMTSDTHAVQCGMNNLLWRSKNDKKEAHPIKCCWTSLSLIFKNSDALKNLYLDFTVYFKWLKNVSKWIPWMLLLMTPDIRLISTKYFTVSNTAIATLVIQFGYSTWVKHILVSKAQFSIVSLKLYPHVHRACSKHALILY